MANKPCTHTELIARVVALETGLKAYKEMMEERDNRYQLRADAQDQSVKVAIVNADKAVAKAEASTEKRFESVNEFREQLADQATRLMPRSEYEVQHTALEEKVHLVERRVGTLEQTVTSILARGGGMESAWGYLVAGVGIVIGAIAALGAYLRH